MAKSVKNEKKSKSDVERSAQGLLRRLSSRYDENRVQAEKKAMKTLDTRDDIDADAHDVVEYSATVELPTLKSRKDKKTASPEEDSGEISKEELEKLYRKYLGGERTSEKTEYGDVYRMVLDAEKRAGEKLDAKSDVEKNIDEAEKYIYEITNGKKNQPIVPEENSETGSFDIPLETTDDLSLFEPKNIDTPNLSATALLSDDRQTDTADDMLPTPAFDPEIGATKEAKLLPEYPYEDPADVQPTIDISAMKDDGGQGLPEDAPKPKGKERSKTDFEYTNTDQNKKILSELRSRYTIAKVRAVMAAAFALILFLIETISPIQALFEDTAVYILVDFILAFACAALIFDRLGLAARDFFRGHFDVDTITLFAGLFSVAATAMALLFETETSKTTLYNFPFAVCVLLNTLSVFYAIRRDVYSFKILSVNHKKLAVELQEREDGTTAGEIQNVDFVTDYFAHKEERANEKASLGVFVPLCFAASAIFFLLSLFVMRHTVSESLSTAYAAFMMCAPFSAFLSQCYPAFLASRRAYANRSAVLCDHTPDRYSEMVQLNFRDAKAFPAGQAKVKSIKLYADRKIDHVIYYASSVYSVIGGPLAGVFKRAALNCVCSEHVELIEHCADGVCAMVDDKNIVIGTPSYMDAQCFETIYEQGDERYEGASSKRIFYLACDQIVIAKFYIQYEASKDFARLARNLATDGVGVTICTADPCLDDGVLYENKMNPERYAIRVERGSFKKPPKETVCAKDAGVVSVGTLKDLLKTLLLCGKLENVKRANLVLRIVSCVLGAAVMALVLFTGKAPEMLSVYPALYQLFWLLPVYIVSRVYV